MAAYASHVLLDWLGSDSSPPIGVMALWPFSRAYYESDLHVFMAISRRYYQGWRFVTQNVLAVSLELVILVPVLALVWRFRDVARSAGCALAIVVRPERDRHRRAGDRLRLRQSRNRLGPAEEHPYDSLLARYRTGAVEPAVEALTKLLQADGGQRQATRWIALARDKNRRADLEAALLLFTDAIMLAWQDDHPFPAAVVARYTSPFMGLRLALKRMDPKTQFLRIWYLLWESFRQVHVNQSLPLDLDFLADALDAFPERFTDAARRGIATPAHVVDVARECPAGSGQRTARDQEVSHGRARLPSPQPQGRCDRIRGAVAPRQRPPRAERPRGRPRSAHWAQLDGRTGQPSSTWRGSSKATCTNAAATGRRPPRLTTARSVSSPVPQTAQVARAHLAHLEGERPQAAAILAPALANRVDRTDPWWAYIRGQAWRFDSYLKMAHAMVMK